MPTIHNNDPIPIFSVNFSFKSNEEKRIIDKKDRVTAAGYAVFKLIFDSTYSHVMKPAIYMKTPISKFKFSNW